MFAVLFIFDPQSLTAISMVVYDVFALGLLIVTYSAARAAKASAELARDSFLKTNRPYMGLIEVQLQTNVNDPEWVVFVGYKNFGTLPAPDVKVRVRLRIAGAIVVEMNEQPTEIHQDATMGSRGAIQVDPARRAQLLGGRAALEGCADILYSLPSGEGCIYNARFVFRPPTQAFEVLTTRTTCHVGAPAFVD
jgi:hypothetical protein